MNDEHESDLQRRIAAWRDQEKELTPNFERVWRRAQHAAANAASAPVSRWWQAWALGVAAAGCVMFMWSRPPVPVLTTDEPPLADAALPTDFLLAAGEDARAGRLADEITALLQP